MLPRDDLRETPQEAVVDRASVPPRPSFAPRPSVPPPAWDLGRTFAKLLCALFALIGVIPIAVAALISSAPIQRWAESETRRLLEAQLGVKAEYEVNVRLLPLRLAITNLKVPSSDGGPPALVTEAVLASPRVFSLLAGRLDLGEIELQKPHVRLVIRDGKLTNLHYKLPDPPKERSSATELPFFSLGISEGRFDVDVDGTQIQTGYIDLDVFVEENDVFELSLRSGKSTLRRERTELTKEIPSTGTQVFDEDVICRLEARVRADKRQILVRRLSLLGVADSDPAQGDPPSCDNVEANTRQVAVRVSQLRVGLKQDGPITLDGHFLARAPLDVTNRFVATLPLRGWAAVSGDVRFDGKSRLPEFKGRVTGGGVEFERYKLARELEVDLKVEDEIILVPNYRMVFADGDVRLKNARIEPFAPGGRLEVEAVEGKGMQFSGLMRDLGVTPNTIVWWELEKTLVRRISGTFSPLKIDGELSADTRDFEVFDRAYHERGRKHMIGVKHATVRGKIGVRPEAFLIYDTRADFGKSSLYTALVSIGFDNTLKLSIPKGGKLDLSDISPLVDIPMAGKAELEVEMAGPGGDPLLTGTMKVAGFEFGGFPLGDIHGAKLRFKPLWVELTDVVAQKGRSTYRLPTAKLDFDTDATIRVDAEASSSSFDLRDFLAMWHFDQDPRWDDVTGETALDARIRYVYGGKEDTCGGGLLETRGKVSLHYAELFGERYDAGEAEFSLRWFDREASYHGMNLKIPSLALRKGPGLILGSVEVTRGAKIAGHLVATSVPLNKLDAVPTLLRGAEARASAEIELGGTLDLLEADAKARLSQVQVGRATLPASEFIVKLTPLETRRPVLRVTQCGGPVTPPFDKNEYAADRPAGLFTVNGALFGGQVKLENLSITRQRNKVVRGAVRFDNVDVGSLGELAPAIALSEARVEGRASGRIDLLRFEMARPSTSEVKVELDALRLSRSGYTVELLPSKVPIELADRKLKLKNLGFYLVTPRGQHVSFDLSGSVQRLDGVPELDATLALRPMALQSLVGVVPRVERATGTLGGSLRLEGPLVSPRASGGFELLRGELVVRGLHAPLSEIDMAVAIEGGELIVRRGSAKLGSGTITLSGGAPLRGFSVGSARFTVRGRDIALPMGEGIRAVADADLVTTFEPGGGKLPRITGDVHLKSFEYRRAVTMTADIGTLAQRGRRTAVDAYDPDDDVVAFDVMLRSTRPLKLQNNLIEAELELGQEGLELVGTNGRFGIRGNVEIARGGRLFLRRSEFEIVEGVVRFDDVTRIAPQVDVTAVTEYRRYADTSESRGGTGGTAVGAPVGASGSSTASVGSGRWNIRLHAHGDADNMKIDLTSDPALAQDDIFLLLTVGLTRAELDQAQSAAVGESVALEALGTLSGADRAVTSAVPLIDEFRFGSAYSSRTGRTEPTVTIGKRLAERVRANVTTGLSESREVRSNVEWKLSNRVSVEGTYDNVNDISSSSVGNLGADIRWRLEFGQ